MTHTVNVILVSGVGLLFMSMTALVAFMMGYQKGRIDQYIRDRRARHRVTIFSREIKPGGIH